MFVLDHLVHFVEKPEKLIDQTKEIGLHTVMGGKHMNWGTYNSLCYFGLAYIEFIGIFDEELFQLAAKEPYTLHETYKNLQLTNGVCRFALRTSTIEEDAKRFQQLGYEVYGPADFSRTRPDGSVLKWKLLHFGKKTSLLDFPFLIQWDEDDESRYAELVEKGTIGSHPLGNIQLTELVYEVENLSFVQEWAELFHCKVEREEMQASIYFPNVIITFIESNNRNGIKSVILSGAKEKKEFILEGTRYLFCE